MKIRVLLSVLLILLLIGSVAAQEPDCPTIITQAVTLLDQAGTMFDNGDLTTGQSLVVGAKALLTPCQESESCTVVPQAIVILDQVGTVADTVTASALLDAAVALMNTCSSNGPATSETVAPTTAPTSAPAETVEAPIPEGLAEKYADLPQSFTEQGYPVLGNPEAPVSVVFYSSFSCSHCSTLLGDVLPVLLERVRAGEINLTTINMQLGSIKEGKAAAAVALCAGQQGQYWEMQDVLYTFQNAYFNDAFINARLLAAVDNMGLDMAAFEACFNDPSTAERAQASHDDAIALGIQAAPTIKVNGVEVERNIDVINQAIDDAMLLAPPAVLVETVEAPIPDGAVEKYAVLPQNFTEQGYPVLGNPEASVNVVIYIGFTSSPANRFLQDRFPALLERVYKGEINLTVINMQVGSIDNGIAAGAAALCAGEQGQYWAMQESLYAFQSTYLKEAFTNARLLSGAKNLGLDMAAFETCFNDPATAATVQATHDNALAAGMKTAPRITVNGREIERSIEDINLAIDDAIVAARNDGPGPDQVLFTDWFYENRNEWTQTWGISEVIDGKYVVDFDITENTKTWVGIPGSKTYDNAPQFPPSYAAEIEFTVENGADVLGLGFIYNVTEGYESLELARFTTSSYWSISTSADGILVDGETPISLQNGQTYVMRLEVTPSSRRLYLDDALIALGPAPNTVVEGTIGLYVAIQDSATGSVRVEFDNLIIRSLPLQIG